MGKVYGIVLAAGQGTRMGGQTNKQLLELAGQTLVERSVRALVQAPVDGIVLVVAQGQQAVFKSRLGGLISKFNLGLAAGGATRGDSVWQGLKALPRDVEYVVVHDGARPLVRPSHIRAAVQAARQWGAAVLAVPVKDTIKVAGPDGLVQKTPARETLWQVQTPQVFSCPLLRQAHRAAQKTGYSGTDDASLVEKIGHPVKLVTGSYSNIKITTPEDLHIAARILTTAGS